MASLDPSQETLGTERAGRALTAVRRRYLALFEPESSRVIELPDSGELVVGRGEEAALRLNDAKVSRRHARFVLSTEVVVSDQDSQNGTFVNGERLSAPRVLVSGDVVEIGAAALVFHAAAPPRKAAPGDLGELLRWSNDEIERAGLAGRPLAIAAIVPAEVAQLGPGSARLGAERLGLERIANDGDRWVVLLPECGADEALARVHELVAALARDGIAARAGVALHPADGYDADTLLGAARAAAAGASIGQVATSAASQRVIDVGGAPIVVADPAMLRLYALIERLARSDLPVLVHGETGAGKELAARALHAWSARRGARLVAVNCAALSENLAESELFGHERGAFTGAVNAKLGLLEAADRGTIFFDEIGDLPIAIQVKLLRALDTGRITRVGSVDERPIDVRVVAATHKHLEQEVAQGRFRQDLYFRLSGATLWIPPLRDRPRELALLARGFLDRARARLGRPAMTLSDEALRALSAHPFPGNVRELENVMEFLAAAHDDAVLDGWQVADRLGSSAAAPTEPPRPISMPPSPLRSLEDEVRELERTRILQALEAAGGNQRQAARLIQMPLRTFVSKLSRYGLREQQRR